jgi:hypothetical protein
LPATETIRSPSSGDDEYLDIRGVDLREGFGARGPVAVLGLIIVSRLCASNFDLISGLFESQEGIMHFQVLIPFIDQDNGEGFV